MADKNSQACDSSCMRRAIKTPDIRTNKMILMLFAALFALPSVVSVAAKAFVITSPTVDSTGVVRVEISAERNSWPFLYPAKIRKVPATWNRYTSPWYVPDRVRFLTLEESRYRVLYSPVRPAASDGLGHCSAIMNAEIGVALRLGLSYSHRVSTHGSLTKDNPNAVEEFFGWGHGQIPREFIRDSFCKSSLNFSHKTCHVCEGLKRNTSFPVLHFKHLVELPYNLTYGRTRCVRSGNPLLKNVCKEQQESFMKQNNRSHTIFQMPLLTCGSNPADSFFDRTTRAYLFNSYWDQHGAKGIHKNASDTVTQSNLMQNYNIPILQVSGRKKVIDYPEHALNIAIHARRGDFFKEAKRNMVSTAAFGRVLRDFMAIVQERGGIFSRMPIVVHMYSEGAPKEKNRFEGHDISRMTELYMDSDGKVRDEKWVTQTIRASGTAEIPSNTSVNHSQDVDSKKLRRLLLFPGGLRVKFHIAADTLQSMHEMISADVFIGSESGLSMHIVSTMSRGLYFLPTRLASYEFECCQATFHPESGALIDPESVKLFWDAFAEANEASATRAYYAYKTQNIRR